MHPLYKESRAALIRKCNETGLTISGKKCYLVQCIAESEGGTSDWKFLTERDLYDGNKSSISSTTAGLIKLSVAHLRAILRHHNVLEVGIKDELVARVDLFKRDQPEASFSRERLCVFHYISVTKEIYGHQ